MAWNIILYKTSRGEKPVRNYLGFKLNWYNFVTIHVYQQKIRIYVRKTILESDKNKRFKKVPESWAWGKTPNSDDLRLWDSVVKMSYESSAIAQKFNQLQ